eukprot:5436526-Prorocentrum_lima.AAC.1
MAPVTRSPLASCRAHRDLSLLRSFPCMRATEQRVCYTKLDGDTWVASRATRVTRTSRGPLPSI